MRKSFINSRDMGRCQKYFVLLDNQSYCFQVFLHRRKSIETGPFFLNVIILAFENGYKVSVAKDRQNRASVSKRG